MRTCNIQAKHTLSNLSNPTAPEDDLFSALGLVTDVTEGDVGIPLRDRFSFTTMEFVKSLHVKVWAFGQTRAFQIVDHRIEVPGAAVISSSHTSEVCLFLIVWYADLTVILPSDVFSHLKTSVV